MWPQHVATLADLSFGNRQRQKRSEEEQADSSGDVDSRAMATDDATTQFVTPAQSAAMKEEQRRESVSAASKRRRDIQEDALPLQHVITAELYMPRDFAASLLVHVAQEPALIDVLQARCFYKPCSLSICPCMLQPMCSCT